MQEEFEEVCNVMENVEEKKIYELHFLKGKIHKQNCVLVKSGIGKVNATRVTQILIDNFQPTYVINLGAAGALNPMLNIGDIVIGNEVVQHDFDITSFGHAKGYITGVGDRIFSDDVLVSKFEQCIKNVEEMTYKIKLGKVASGDIFVTDIAMKDKIYAKFDADCVEMEGAAIAQVCYLDNIPFVVVRSISDSPNGKNHITFDEYLELASKRCARILQEFFK